MAVGGATLQRVHQQLDGVAGLAAAVLTQALVDAEDRGLPLWQRREARAFLRSRRLDTFSELAGVRPEVFRQRVRACSDGRQARN